MHRRRRHIPERGRDHSAGRRLACCDASILDGFIDELLIHDTSPFTMYADFERAVELLT